jgi:hypothetical protein
LDDKLTLKEAKDVLKEINFSGTKPTTRIAKEKETCCFHSSTFVGVFCFAFFG